MIVDDEPNAVSLLDLLISETTDWQVVARCYNGVEALQALKTNNIELVFLDINMPQLNGMELAALLPKDIKLIFTTAYAEYGAESYLHNALDYILKPITLKRFLATQQKIEAWFLPARPRESTQPEIAIAHPAAADHLFIKTGKSFQKVLITDILYIEGEKEYIKLVTVKEELLVFKRMKEVQEQLPPPFTRVHNSYIVNLEKMNKFTDNHILIAGKRIPVSEKYRVPFMDYLNRKLF